MSEKRLSNPATWSFEKIEMQHLTDKARTLLDVVDANVISRENGTVQRDFSWVCPNGDEARLLELSRGGDSVYRLSVHEETGVGVHRNYAFCINGSDDTIFEEKSDQQSTTDRSKLQLCNYVGETLEEGTKTVAQEMQDYDEVRLMMAKTLLKESSLSKKLAETIRWFSRRDEYLFHQRQVVGSAYLQTRQNVSVAGRALTLDDFEKAGDELLEEAPSRRHDTPHN